MERNFNPEIYPPRRISPDKTGELLLSQVVQDDQDGISARIAAAAEKNRDDARKLFGERGDQIIDWANKNYIGDLARDNS